MSQDRIRSFIAVDLDDSAIRDRIVAAQDGLQQTGAQLKLVDAQIMHLTLRFLGEIPRTTVDRVKEILNALQFKRFQIRFEGLGCFPSLSRINVVWVGLKQGKGELDEIFQNVEPKLRQIGVPGDNKGLNPHLTIARVRTGLNKDALAAYVTKMENQEFGSMQVSSVRLKKSTLTPKGPIYETMLDVKAAT